MGYFAGCAVFVGFGRRAAARRHRFAGNRQSFPCSSSLRNSYPRRRKPDRTVSRETLANAKHALMLNIDDSPSQAAPGVATLAGRSKFLRRQCTLIPKSECPYRTNMPQRFSSTYLNSVEFSSALNGKSINAGFQFRDRHTLR